MYAMPSHPLTHEEMARNRLVEANLGLVGHTVNKLRHGWPVRRLGNDYAMEIGNEALVRAADKFDPNFYVNGCKVKFSTYAVTVISREILAVALADTLIHVPSGIDNLNRPEAYRKAAHKARGIAQLKPDFASYEDTTADDSDEREVNHEQLYEAMSHLRCQQREVLQLYFFEDLSLREVGERLGHRTRSWAQLVVKKALEEMRKIMVQG